MNAVQSTPTTVQADEVFFLLQLGRRNFMNNLPTRMRTVQATAPFYCGIETRGQMAKPAKTNGVSAAW